MGEGIVLALVAAVWFVFRKRIAAYQVYLLTEKFKVIPVRGTAEQARGMEWLSRLFYALLFVADPIGRELCVIPQKSEPLCRL